MDSLISVWCQSMVWKGLYPALYRVIVMLHTLPLWGWVILGGTRVNMVWGIALGSCFIIVILINTVSSEFVWDWCTVNMPMTLKGRGTCVVCLSLSTHWKCKLRTGNAFFVLNFDASQWGLFVLSFLRGLLGLEYFFTPWSFDKALSESAKRNWS